MVPKEEFMALMENIVAETAPAEDMAFVVSGPQLADTLYEKGKIDTSTSTRPGEFQFMAETTHVLQFVGIMAGTFNAVQKVLETIRGGSPAPAKETVCPVWAKELQAAGVPEKMAKEVSEMFAARLKQMLEESKTAL